MAIDSAGGFQPGDTVELGGYLTMAHADHKEDGREFILVHNESSHFLLFVREQNGVGSGLDSGPATFLQSWDYHKLTTEQSWALYNEALIRMVKLASAP